MIYVKVKDNVNGLIGGVRTGRWYRTTGGTVPDTDTCVLVQLNNNTTCPLFAGEYEFKEE